MSSFSRMLAALALLAPAAAAAPVEAVLERQAWPSARDHRAVLSLAALRTVLEAYDERTGMRLVIRYPGGDLGNAWAFEVRDWMVSFGVPSAAISLLPGSGGPDRVVLTVEPGS